MFYELIVFLTALRAFRKRFWKHVRGKLMLAPYMLKTAHRRVCLGLNLIEREPWRSGTPAFTGIMAAGQRVA